MRTSFLVLLTCCGLAWSLIAQPLIAQPDVELVRPGVEDGLPEVAVYVVLQDHLGFLWLGTPNGLVRWDGHGYQTFKHDPEDPQSLSGRSIYALHEDRAGDLWIATRRGGLNRFDRSAGRFESFRHDPEDPTSLSVDAVTSICEGRDGSLWIGTGDLVARSLGGGLNRLDPHTRTFTHFRHDPEDPSSLSGDVIVAVVEDPGGDLWIATASAGLNRLKPRSGHLERFRHDPARAQSLASDHLSTLYIDRDGTLWIGTRDGGLDRFDRATRQFIHHRPDANDPNRLIDAQVLTVFEDGENTLWVSTWGGGLHRYDPAEEAFVRLGDPEDLRSRTSFGVFDIIEDRSGILWFAAGGAGLWKFDRYADRFLSLRHDPESPNGLISDRVFDIEEDHTGTLWMATDRGLDALDPRTGRHTAIRHSKDARSLGDDRVRVLESARDGSLWVGTESGLDHFEPDDSEPSGLEPAGLEPAGLEPAGLEPDGREPAGSELAGGTFTHYRHDPENPQSIGRGRVTALLEDHRGMLWVGTGGGGLGHLDPAHGTFTHFRHDPANPRSLGDDWVIVLFEDHEGTLWVGTDTMGLQRFHPEHGTFTRYFAPLVGLDTVLALEEDRAGQLWVGTWGGGLHLFDRASGESRALTVRHGLPGDTVRALLEDDHGRLWISTDRGVAVRDPTDGSFRVYDHRDGLQRRLYNGSACRTRRGELFFGGEEGVNIFFPEIEEAHRDPPSVVLTSFQIFNRPVQPAPGGPLTRHISVAEEIRLRHDQNVISFEFAALHFANPARNRHAYRLDPFDKDWTEVGDRRQATYTNLSPGSYTFRVKAANGDGVWNEEGASIAVLVEPPWWRTWWAVSLFCVALLLATGLFDRTRRARLLLKERERAAWREARLRTEAAELKAQAAEAQAATLRAENERRGRELEAARQLQLSMLPQEVPIHPELEIAAAMTTATEVGGDYYDFNLDDEGTLTLAIGDATGHGTVAGTLVAAAKSFFYLSAHEPDLVATLRRATRAFKGMGLPNLTMSLALARYRRGQLELANAGMPPVLVCRAAGGEVEELAVPGMPLGGVANFPYRRCQVALDPGDTVVFFSDGSPEALSPEGEPLGYERFAEAVRATACQPPGQVIEDLFGVVRDWTGGLAQDDDQTFVVLKVKGGLTLSG